MKTVSEKEKTVSGSVSKPVSEMSIETKRYLAAKYFPHLTPLYALLSVEAALTHHASRITSPC